MATLISAGYTAVSQDLQYPLQHHTESVIQKLGAQNKGSNNTGCNMTTPEN